MHPVVLIIEAITWKVHHYHSSYALTIKQAINTLSAYVSRHMFLCNINRRFNANDKHAHHELSTQVTTRNDYTFTAV